MAETILAIHPDPVKQGVRIDKEKYDIVRASILELLKVHGPMSFMELSTILEDKLNGTFDGSVPWYFTTVKLDLEARGEIRQLPGSKPQLIELA